MNGKTGRDEYYHADNPEDSFNAMSFLGIAPVLASCRRCGRRRLYALSLGISYTFHLYPL